MSGKKRRWPAETNLAALKTLARTLLWFDIQPTRLSPLVVKHPFTDSGLVGIHCCFANKLRKFFKQSAKKKRRLKGF